MGCGLPSSHKLKGTAKVASLSTQISAGLRLEKCRDSEEEVNKDLLNPPPSPTAGVGEEVQRFSSTAQLEDVRIWT